MLGYNYNYKSFGEILDLTGKLSNMSAIEFLICIIVVVCVIIWIFILLPILILWYKQRVADKKKRDKKKLLTQILLQKEIEDEVEKEIKLKEENQK